MLEKDLTINEKWILSGAVCGWGDNLKSYFDLVVFLWIPQDIRLERLRHREFQRYGNEVLAGGSKYEQSKAFLSGLLYMILLEWKLEVELCMNIGWQIYLVQC